jgi:hypothetical protein
MGDITTYLQTRQDNYLTNTINFGDLASLNNIKEQVSGVLVALNTLESDFVESVQFLSEQLDAVLGASASLDVIEGRLMNIKEAINFIMKTRFEIAESTKGVSLVDLSKGEFSGLFYNLALQGITFGKQ